MKKFIIVILVLLFLFLALPKEKQNNILKDRSITWGNGWKEYKSVYSGSEFFFTVTHSNVITFEAKSSNNEPGLGVDIFLNDKVYTLETPQLNTKKLTIIMDHESQKKENRVRVRHFCSGSTAPCEITIKSIEIDANGKILSTPIDKKKVIAFLGDSIALGWGRYNYTFMVADKINYQLHNASIFGSTITKVNNADYSYSRYRKDLLSYKPDKIVIFMGTNDLSYAVPLDTFSLNYEKLITALRKEIPHASIITVGLLIRKDFSKDEILKYSDVIKSISNRYNISYLESIEWLSTDDLMDSVHPSLFSQSKLAENFIRHYEQINKNK